MKKLLVIFAVVVVLGALLGAIAYFHGTAGSSNDATPVRIESVTRGELIELVQAPGEIQPRTKVSISARVAARIAELPIPEGAKVKKGDVLVRLDSTDLEAALKSSEARYAAQKAQITVSQARVRAQQAQVDACQSVLAEAQRDLNRQTTLLVSHDVSQSAVDQAQRRYDEQKALVDAARQTLQAEESNLVVLQHNLDAADADIARARDNLSYATIVSPIDGLITKLNAKIGELVVTGTLNTPGTVILEVADFSEMLLVARVDEANIASVKVGQHARIHTQAYGERVFDGRVETVALAQSGGSVNQQLSSTVGRYFKVEILVNSNGERLFSGLTADVEIETQKHIDSLKAPSQAVLGRPTDDLPVEIRDKNPLVDRKNTQTTVVYRFVDGKAIVTPVKVGQSDLTHTIIEKGLDEGDRIVTGPYKVLEKIANDQKIKDEKASATQPATNPAKDQKK